MPAVPEAEPRRPPSAIAAGDLSGKLKWYYARLFPNDLFTRWLRYGSDDVLSRREISFTLPGDIYIRWLSFATPDLLLRELAKLAPVKIDVGAVYNHPPAQKNAISAPLTPMQKELVFDIDMTDYEDVMPDPAHASAVDVCDRNWAYMATAVRVLDAALRADFGFRRILWVYSGRRGIHCWVADARARALTNEQRSAVADYLHLRFEGRENAGRRQAEVTVPLHPALARAKRACDRAFRDVALADNAMLDGPQRLRDMLAVVPNRAVADAIAQRVDRVAGGEQRWARVAAELARAGKSDYGVRAAADYIVMRYTYPRLDVAVSKEINHLLKAPFCVHPKTGRVCVPFRAEDAEAFQPGAQAPTLGRLLEEMREVDGEFRGVGEASDRLREAVTVFEEFVRGVEEDVRADMRAEKLAGLDRRQAAEMMRD